MPKQPMHERNAVANRLEVREFRHASLYRDQHRPSPRSVIEPASEPTPAQHNILSKATEIFKFPPGGHGGL